MDFFSAVKEKVHQPIVEHSSVLRHCEYQNLCQRIKAQLTLPGKHVAYCKLKLDISRMHDSFYTVTILKDLVPFRRLKMWSLFCSMISEGYFDTSLHVCYCEMCHKLRGEELYHQKGEPPKEYATQYGWCMFKLRYMYQVYVLYPRPLSPSFCYVWILALRTFNRTEFLTG